MYHAFQNRSAARSFLNTLVIAVAAVVVAGGISDADTTPKKAKPNPGKWVIIPNATPIRVQTSATLLPSTASVNQTFEIKSVDDVVVNGYIVVAKGAVGQGTITETGSAKANCAYTMLFHHKGCTALRIRFDWITAVDNEKIRVADLTTDGSPEGSNPAVPSPSPDYATSTTLSTKGVATGAIPNLQTFTTYVATTVQVVSKQPKADSVEQEAHEGGFAAPPPSPAP